MLILGQWKLHLQVTSSRQILQSVFAICLQPEHVQPWRVSDVLL